MTNKEYANYKGFETLAAFSHTEQYPNEYTLDIFRQDVWGWMTEYIGNTKARSTYDTNMQYKLRNIEYRAVELLVSGEIAKNKIENYIGNSITELFGETDKAEADAADEEINRGVVEG